MTEQPDYTWSSRITRTGTENPAQLLANPHNYRRHTREQQEAMEAVLDTVGWVRDVIVNERTGHVLDGHMRVELAMRTGADQIPVTYVDMSEEDEQIVLLTFDPIAELAVTDGGKLRAVAEDALLPDPLQRLIDAASGRERAPDDLPSGVDERRGRESTMDAYLNGDQRQIHLPMLADEYALVEPAIRRIRDSIGGQRNTDALIWLIEQDAEEHGEAWAIEA